MEKEWHGTLRSYLIGLLASLILTFISFTLVITKVISGNYLAISLVGLAIIQAIVQLRYFLHLSEEDKPQWETGVFYFMVTTLLIIALGSLWIMHNLNDRVMS